MTQGRTGYVIEVPLGLWASIEFQFVDDGDGGIRWVQAALIDDGRLYDVPARLEEFVEAYLSTWLLKKSARGPYWTPQRWVGSEFWQEQTAERLDDLVSAGQATRRDDLD